MGPAADWKRVLATLAPAFTERAATYDNTDEFVAENYADMRAARLFSALVPRELGGSGLAYSEACVLIRGLAMGLDPIVHVRTANGSQEASAEAK